MPQVYRRDLPAGALLGKYARTAGCHTDCYAVVMPGNSGFSEFVAAFYTTWLFKLERLILTYAVSRPSTDDGARAVAEGKTDRFAAWTVEDRSSNQLLMCDISGKTRSWFMRESDGAGTRFYFGSAVVPSRNRKTGEKELGIMFSALLGFHKLYSRALLWLAVKRLSRTVGSR